MHESLDADYRLLLDAAGVIAGPLAERTFVAHIVGMNEALESDFRMRRDRQAGARPGDDFDRLADQSAGRVVFIAAIGDFEAGDHEQCRMHAADDRDRARLAALVVAASDKIAMLAFRAHDRCHIGLVRLHAIGAVIDPAGVRIAHDHHVAGANVIAAVMLVPARYRNFENVDVGAGAHIFHDRAALDGDG